MIIYVTDTNGQSSAKLTLSNSSFVSSEKIPMWLHINTDGRTERGNSFLNLSEIDAEGTHFFNDSNLIINAGATLNYGAGNNSRYFQATRLFTRVNLKNWELRFGMYYNDLFFDGLSTSNGNIAKSRNARPLPRISLRVSEYKPVPFFTKFLFFKGEYDEGFLTDERFVDKAHLHHKSLYLKLKFSEDFSIAGGVEHFVMWGGTSRDEKIGKLPSDFHSYIKYITGSQGDFKFPVTDQLNVAGNQYGTYQISANKNFKTFEAGLNISHPFEDFSGVNLHNWPDNMISFTIKLKDEKKAVTRFIYEFTNTRQQSIKDSLHYWSDEEQKWKSHEFDNYYNHGVYKSAVTYYQRPTSSPLFFPLKTIDNISRGSESTRFFAHHIGLTGNISKSVSWKSMVTFIRHFGIWNNPYKTTHKQTSLLLNFLYSGKTTPFDIDLSLAGDIMNTSENDFGVKVGIRYNIRH